MEERTCKVCSSHALDSYTRYGRRGYCSLRCMKKARPDGMDSDPCANPALPGAAAAIGIAVVNSVIR